MNTTKIAQRLRDLRGTSTQQSIAKALSLSQSTYAMYETGQRIPSDENKQKIAILYNTTVQAIFFNPEDHE